MSIATFILQLNEGTVTLTSTNAPSGGTYVITGISGSISGSNITGLVAPGNTNNDYYTASGGFTNDNVADTTAPTTGYLSGNHSIEFTTQDGKTWALYNDGQSHLLLDGYDAGQIYFSYPAEPTSGYSYSLLSSPTTTVTTASFSADTGVSATDFVTNTAAQTISGTLSANLASGESVEVSLNNGSTWATATTTVGQSTWFLSSQTLTASDTLKVRVSNAAGFSTSYSHGYTLDTSVPTVSSITASTANGTYGVGDMIAITVNFSESVTVTGTPQLALETGTTDRVINYASGTGTSTLTFNYTIQAGDASADLDYLSTGALSLNAGTIRDAAGNNATLTLPSPGASGSLGANKALVIDTAPTISSSTYNASTGVLTVTGTNMSATVGALNDIDVQKLTITGEGGSTYTLVSSSDVEITSSTSFSVTLTGSDLAAVNQILNKTGTSSTTGTTYNLGGAAGWDVSSSGAADTLGNGITVFNVLVPTITAATYDANTGSLVVTGTGFSQRSGATNDIVANKFTVTGQGGATYTLTDTANVDITSGTSFTLVLSATDKAGVNLLLNQNGTSSSGATTYNLAAAEDWAAGADAAVVTADLTSNGITVSNVVDTTPPSAPSTPDMTLGTDSGSSSTDNITNDTTPTFSGTTEANATVRLYDTDGTTQLGSGTADGSGTWSITSTALSAGAHTITAKATDASNNTSVASSGLTITIDTTAPAVPSAPDMTTGTDTGASNSDDITNDTTPTFTGTSEANASVTMYDTDGTTVLVTTTADGGGLWSMTSSTLSAGSHTLTTKATDVAGNVSSASSGLSISIDTTAPTVSTINRVTSALTNATSVDYTVSFAENVNGVDTSDFLLTYTGTASGSIASIAPVNASTYTVTVNALSGNGTVRLDLKNSGTGISDTAGNAIAAGFTSGQVYTLDNTAPAVTSVAVPASSTYTTGQSLDFTVNFGENVTVDTSGGTPYVALILDTGGTVHASYLSGSGTSALVFRYTVQSGNADANGVAVGGAIVANGGTLRDAAGNNATLTLNSVGTTTSVLVDALPPTTTIATAVFSADTGTSTTDFITATAAQTISGTLSASLAAGESVEVSLDNGATWSTATTTIGQNTWSLAGQALLASNMLKVKVTDVHGSGSVMSQAYVLDTTAPTLQYTTPADNAPAVAVASNIVLNFAEDVIAIAGKSLSLYKTADNSLVETIAVNDVTKVTVAGGVITVDPTTLAETTGYYVLLDSGAFIDAAGNAYGGITSTTAFNFTTLTTPPPAPGNEAPALSLSNPLDNATDVAVDAAIVLTFNELVQAGSGNIVISNVSGARGTADTRTIAIDDPQVSINGRTVTIDLQRDLLPNSTYHVLIDNGALTDMAGLAYAGISNTTALDFLTASGNSEGPGSTPEPFSRFTDTDHDGFPDALEILNGLTVGIKDNDVVSRDDLFVMQLYRDILYREADPGGLAFWTSMLDQNQLSRERVAEAFISANEFQDIVSSVARLYLGTFDRMPDQAGLNYWVEALRAGASLADIGNAFVTSEEFLNLYGSLDGAGFLAPLYNNILNREADLPGLQYWQNQLAAGVSKGQVLSLFTNSSEFTASSLPEITATLTSFGLLGTLPDQATLDALAEDVASGMPLIDIIGTMLASTEYHDRFI